MKGREYGATREDPWNSAHNLWCAGCLCRLAGVPDHGGNRRRGWSYRSFARQRVSDTDPGRYRRAGLRYTAVHFIARNYRRLWLVAFQAMVAAAGAHNVGTGTLQRSIWNRPGDLRLLGSAQA